MNASYTVQPVDKPLQCFVWWWHLGWLHVQVRRDLNQERPDDLIQSIINLASLNAAFKVNAGREENAAELMEAFIHCRVLCWVCLSYHHLQLVQTTLTYTALQTATWFTPWTKVFEVVDRHSTNLTRLETQHFLSISNQKSCSRYKTSTDVCCYAIVIA